MTKVFQGKQDEEILVVPRQHLFPATTVQGFEPGSFDTYQKCIQTHGCYKWRSAMETDPSFKQIIPYLVFMFEDRVFLMQRRAKASEARLQSKLTLGIGGHIRQEDCASRNIIDWARREFAEEVNYDGTYSVQPLGLINDEADEVGQVHTGFAFLLVGDRPTISVRSELKSGELVTLAECRKRFDRLESWSQYVLAYLEEVVTTVAARPFDTTRKARHSG